MYRMLVVSGHYKRKDDGDGVVIELFGRLKDKRSAAVLVEGFDPYFYVVDPRDDAMEYLSGDSMVRKIEDRELWCRGENRQCIKVTITFPFNVPKYRKKLQEMGYEILAADIPFIFRYFYDLDLGVYIEFEGEEIVSEEFHTEVVIRSREVKRGRPFKVRLKVLSFDIENSIRSGEIYMVGYSVGWLPVADPGELQNNWITAPEGTDDQKEREDLIIGELENVIREQDPDIITGYNIDGYDIPHILKRARLLGIEGISMGRDASMLDNMGYRSWRARGRVVVDAWWQAKKTFRPKKETLEAVSNLLLGEGKDDVDTMKIEEEWSKRRDVVIKYCMRDAELALRILDRTMAVKRAIALAYVARLPLTDVINGTTSNLIDSILIREADRNDIGIPLTRHETKTSKIEGAYVHSIDPGLYHWVVVLDFRSMYPSIMIENNVCFTTLTSKRDGTIHSPVPGVNFMKPEDRRGLVPDILEKLMEERQDFKNKRDGAGGRDEKEYYNGLQEAIKILMNSFYGVFASFFYRFTDRSIGSSITAYARENIRSIISTLQGDGLEVIYSDTDSVFVRSPHEELDSTIEFGRGLAERFSTGGRVLEFEKVFRSFFTHGKKKRYVGMIAWPEEQMVVRGYEMRRTDSFDLQSETLQNVFELILDGNIENALDLARKVVAEVKEGKVPISKLVISRTVQEVEEEKIVLKYKNPDSMANVQAMRKTRKLGIEMVPGMKVSWIVVDAKAKPQKVEPYIDGREFDQRPDYGYYAERLSSTLARATDVFGLSEKELLSGIQQTSLFDGFDGDSTNEETPVDRKIAGGKDQNPGRTNQDNITLDHWM